ncbi:MAG: hypothetical protein K0R27_1710 [Xanthobacteraceae bacterium]|jgi:hypothetical protein|nr:hypothetical protein [Xanthobacteraceae bacterium]
MSISKLAVGGLAAAGLTVLALAPAQAGDLYISTSPAPVYQPAQVYESAPVYEPAPVYEAYPAPERHVIVREAPARVIVRERGPREVYVRDVPVPPAPVGGYYEGGYADDGFDDGCRTLTRETPSGRIITVGNTCD